MQSVVFGHRAATLALSGDLVCTVRLGVGAHSRRSTAAGEL